VTVGTTNLYLDRGTSDPQDSSKSIKQGLYVTELIGFGVTASPCDYSRARRPVDRQRRAGVSGRGDQPSQANLLEMFQAIEGVGTDLVFRDRTASPTVLIGRMTVAGA